MERLQRENFLNSKGIDAFEVESVRLKLRDILFSLTHSESWTTEVHGAILDSKGDLIDVMGPNPLHYPALESCAKAARKYLALKHGETIITNDPYCGNSRLCDVILIQGAFGKNQANELRYHIVLQITHNGLIRKNLNKIFETVEDEGYRVPPTLLDHGSGMNMEIVKYLAMSGVPQETLVAQFETARGLLKKAGQSLAALENSLGRENMAQALEQLRKYSETAMKRALHDIPDGEYTAHDALESDGVDSVNVRIQCKFTVRGENILLGFSGSSKQVKGPYNCNYALTLGACFWVLRSLVKLDIPINSGAFKSFSVEAPDGTVVNARYPAPLLGGYFETTKRITDTLNLVLNKALPGQFAAQNSGSSNVTLMAFDSKLMIDTLGSGSGASNGFAGTDCVKAELHNFECPSIEEVETQFPIQVTHSGIREISGGSGKFEGGNGLTRGYRFLKKAQVMALADRRSTKAKGLYGGVSGLNGEYMIMKTAEKKKIQNEKWVAELGPGDTLVINTPGGGGWGKKEEPEAEPEA